MAGAGQVPPFGSAWPCLAPMQHKAWCLGARTMRFTLPPAHCLALLLSHPGARRPWRLPGSALPTISNSCAWLLTPRGGASGYSNIRFGGSAVICVRPSLPPILLFTVTGIRGLFELVGLQLTNPSGHSSRLRRTLVRVRAIPPISLQRPAHRFSEEECTRELRVSATGRERRCPGLGFGRFWATPCLEGHTCGWFVGVPMLGQLPP